MQYNHSNHRLSAGGTVSAIPAAFRKVNVEINYQSATAERIRTQQFKRNVVQKSDSTTYF